MSGLKAAKEHECCETLEHSVINAKKSEKALADKHSNQKRSLAWSISCTCWNLKVDKKKISLPFSINLRGLPVLPLSMVSAVSLFSWRTLISAESCSEERASPLVATSAITSEKAGSSASDPLRWVIDPSRGGKTSAAASRDWLEPSQEEEEELEKGKLKGEPNRAVSGRSLSSLKCLPVEVAASSSSSGNSQTSSSLGVPGPPLRL